jgi:hypothetical protein
MRTLDDFFDDIDGNRTRRARELSDIKLRLGSGGSDIESKALVVLAYAHWEGFYNDCTRAYLSFLRTANAQVSSVSWPLLAGALSSEIDRMRDRNHSMEARIDFIQSIQAALTCDFGGYDDKSIMARSNLDFAKLSLNWRLMSFELSPFQAYRLRIDKELVGWRHQVAHGDSPDLTRMDAGAHIDLVTTLQLMVADQFQEGMMNAI